MKPNLKKKNQIVDYEAWILQPRDSNRQGQKNNNQEFLTAFTVANKQQEERLTEKR
jgi:hypothetical protein